MQDLTETLTGEITEPLRRTRPWMKFLAIMGFIGCGFVVLDTLFLFFGFILHPADTAPRGLPRGWMMLLALIYLVTAFFVYFMPSLLLIRSASALDGIESEGTLSSIAEASERQRRFWKYCGILLIVAISIVLLTAIAAAIVIPMILAARHHYGTF